MQIKKYHCPKCKLDFTVKEVKTFIKTIMPICPYCGNRKGIKSEYILEKEDK